MALKVQYTVKRDTNVPGIPGWKSHRIIIKYNRWKLQSPNWDPMIKSSVLSPFNFYVFNDFQRYPMNRFECESPPRTNSMKKNHLHINETPFHVDVLCHPAERYITGKGAVPKQIPMKPQK